MPKHTREREDGAVVPSEPNALATLLRRYMRRENLTASRFARRVGLSKQTISNLLLARNRAQLGTLALIAQKTAIPLEDLEAANAEYATPPEDPVDSVDAVLDAFSRMSPAERQRVLERITRHAERVEKIPRPKARAGSR